jgi:hypothetical protein
MVGDSQVFSTATVAQLPTQLSSPCLKALQFVLVCERVAVKERQGRRFARVARSHGLELTIKDGPQVLHGTVLAINQVADRFRNRERHPNQRPQRCGPDEKPFLVPADLDQPHDGPDFILEPPKDLLERLIVRSHLAWSRHRHRPFSLLTSPGYAQ